MKRYIMTVSPSLSQEEAEEQARCLKAISDPTRLRILAVLRQYGDTLTVEKLVEHFDLAQPTISHHLRIMFDAHIITRHKAGLYVYYRCDREGLERALSIVQGLL